MTFRREPSFRAGDRYRIDETKDSEQRGKAPAGRDRVCLPLDTFARLQDRPVDGQVAETGRAIADGGCFSESAAEALCERLDPRHCKPHQCSRSKRKAETECGLIGRYRIVAVLRRPLSDHELVAGFTRWTASFSNIGRCLPAISPRGPPHSPESVFSISPTGTTQNRTVPRGTRRPVANREW
jgi:hypothetical protein